MYFAIPINFVVDDYLSGLCVCVFVCVWD